MSDGFWTGNATTFLAFWPSWCGHIALAGFRPVAVESKNETTIRMKTSTDATALLLCGLFTHRPVNSHFLSLRFVNCAGQTAEMGKNNL